MAVFNMYQFKSKSNNLCRKYLVSHFNNSSCKVLRILMSLIAMTHVLAMGLVPGKGTSWHVRPAKTQISLRIRAV